MALFLSVFVSVITFTRRSVFICLAASAVRSVRGNNPSTSCSMSRAGSCGVLSKCIGSIGPGFGVLYISAVASLTNGLRCECTLVCSGFVIRSYHFAIRDSNGRVASLSNVALFSSAVRAGTQVSLDGTVGTTGGTLTTGGRA